MKSKNVALLVSKGAWAKFANLQADTPKEHIDNVFFEYRLALELKRKGMIKRIIPIWAGEVEAGEEEAVYGDFFEFADNALVNVPKVKDEVVLAVEAEVEAFLQQFGLGGLATRPEERTVDAVLKRMMRFQGPKLFTKGGESFTFEKAVSRLEQAVQGQEEDEEEDDIGEELVEGGGDSGGGGDIAKMLAKVLAMLEALSSPLSPDQPVCTPVLVRQMSENTLDRKAKEAAYMSWLEQYAPDIKPMNREAYAKRLYGADVTSIQRLARGIKEEEDKQKGGGKAWLLSFGITEANAEEIVLALQGLGCLV